MIHDDGIEWAVLDAEAAVHADIGINVKFCRLSDGPTRLRVIGANDPDALRRANLGANSARRATDFFLAVRTFIVNQKRHIAEFFRRGKFFFRILHSKYTARILAGAMSDAFRIIVAVSPPGDVIKISIHKPLEGYAETFDDSFSIHGFFSNFYRSSSPSTMSIAPNMATKSAILVPTHILSRAVMLIKDGART